MARIFSLSAECGDLRQNAENFGKYFRAVQLRLSDEREISCTADTYQDRDGNWWSVVIPEGLIIGGVGTDSMLRKKEGATEAGFLLYELLKSAPPFRYAIVGLEVDIFLEESEFKTTDYWREYNGIVLSKDFFKRLDGQIEVEEFTPNYYWRPYLGEKQDL